MAVVLGGECFLDLSATFGNLAERLLSILSGHEMAERETHRLACHRAESDLPPDKSIDSFDFAAVPSVSKPHVAALIDGNGWLEQGANVKKTVVSDQDC